MYTVKTTDFSLLFSDSIMFLVSFYREFRREKGSQTSSKKRLQGARLAMLRERRAAESSEQGEVRLDKGSQAS